MILKPFLVGVALAFAGVAKADSPAAEKVAYIAKVPTQIRKGALGRKYTRFFGKTVIAGQNFALHFYDTQRLQTDENGSTFQKSRLDIYLENRSKNRSAYKRVNTIPITYPKQEGGFDEEKLVVQVEKRWLTPKIPTKPVLHFALITTFTNKPQTRGEASYELKDGIDALFVFPAGMTSPAVVQQFATYSDSSSYQSNDFSTLDKKGDMTVYRTSLSHGAQGFEGWQWKENQFVEVDQNWLGIGEIGQCRWDGEKIIKTVWN